MTYANEWATVASDSAPGNKGGFTPQSRPAINTNFEREWTVRETGVIRYGVLKKKNIIWGNVCSV